MSQITDKILREILAELKTLLVGLRRPCLVKCSSVGCFRMAEAEINQDPLCQTCHLEKLAMEKCSIDHCPQPALSDRGVCEYHV